MSFNVHTADGRAAGSLEISRTGLMTVFEYSCDFDPGPSRLVLAGDKLFPVGVPQPRSGGLSLNRKFSRLGLGDFDPDAPFRALLVPVDADLAALLTPEEPDHSEPAAPEADSPADPVPDTIPDTEPDPGPEAPVEEPQGPCPEPSGEPESPCSDEALPDGTAGNESAPESCEWAPDTDPASHFEDPILRAAASGIQGVITKPDGEDTLLGFPWAPSRPFPMLPVFRLGTAMEIDGGQYMVFRLKGGRPM